ncbi:hypothetical protein L2725_10380 [Shewanella corallii]|uniref:Uncharacterized protein n=1 Tax=Shewanella corallii TaxID=560080 RepID=A0ABT0N6T7_9GAMM|nr:hypothetical protein [Shewanella corallii]MCL2914172.1 hypothetical protein [Shewanella corallii]
MKKHKDYSSVIFKYFVVIGVFANIGLAVANYQTQTKWVGSVESSKFSWTVYTIQNNDRVNVDVIYSIADGDIVEEKSETYDYRFWVDDENTLLLENDNMKLKNRRTSYYFIDDECRLSFRGSEKMKTSNFHMVCRFK